MTKYTCRRMPVVPVFLFCLMMLTSCDARKVHIIERGQQPETRAASYQKINLNHFDAEERLAASSPGIAAACEDAVLRELMKIGSAPMIFKSAGSLKQDNTLIVRVRLFLTDAKAQRQPSPLTAHVRLIDASTGKTVNEENIAAPAPPKTSAPGTPGELGIAVARHIDKFMQGQ